MSPEKIKHLEFIQNVITRMNTNSFQIKGWCIVIASALLAIFASTKDNYFFLVAVFSNSYILVFGCVLPKSREKV